MVDDPDALRQMAEHRGLKLVKSRRRKPGTGDYGKFGLTDAAGKPLLGVGKNGLTASAQDVESYLRSGTLGSWQESASATPDKPAPPRKARAPVAPAPVAPPKPTVRKPVAPAKAPPPPKPPPAPEPEPQLALRPATSADASALARLLGQLRGITLDADTARRNLAAAQNAGGGLLLAEWGKPVGCCGWAVVPTVHRGPLGRITVLYVAEDYRRRGIARQLLEGAEHALAGAGCTLVEAMSDIQIDNAHNFFRALKFEQASYRFTRYPVD